MNRLRAKKQTGMVASLICVIAACIALNLLGKSINDMIGLPLYIDNIGTLLSALIGGHVPCITVGFLTNIIGGFTNEYTAYYCVISVFIAVAAVNFTNRKMLTRFPHVIIAVLTFAFLGGVAGGLVTLLINGFSFGEGAAVDFAEMINKAVPLGYIPSNFISCFLIDLADKALVTAIAVLIYKPLPHRLTDYLKAQSWYYMTVFEKRSEQGRRRMSLRVKVTLLVAVSTTMVAATAIGVSIVQYRDSAIERYEEQGQCAARLIADKIDRAKLAGYMERGRSAPGYTEAEGMLESIRDSSPEIKFIYIYQVTDKGCRVVFDLDTEDVEADEAGELIEYDDTIEKYAELFLKGEAVSTDITDDIDGRLVSVYEPIRDASGEAVCYVGVDMSMDKLRSEAYAFLSRIISLFIGFLIVIRTYAVWLADRKIIALINKMAYAAERVAFDTPQARAESIEMLEKLDIDTGDEIEHLYHAYKGATADTARYIDEVQKKSGQIAKLQNGLVLVLADMVESRDQCTGDHVRKTAAYAGIILRQMQKEGIYADQLSEEFISEVVNSAPLHDVGKITVSDAILNKPGKLTDEEFNAMKSHTTEGGKIIDKAITLVSEESGFLTEARNMAACHHEKWNGKGYPNGASGEDIPLSARVMAVADVFDALVSRRSYKEPFTVEKAFDIIRNDAGTHFDPLVVQAFLDAGDEVRRVAAMNMDI